MAEVFPHGGAPHKAIYRYQLALPSQQILWKAAVKFTTVLNFAEDHQRAARKIAGKLANDRRKAAKKSARS